jgi:4-hydroxybenzoate polyprenyltransferase
MNATTAVRMPRLSTLLRLGRISNMPTVWTNVLAGSVIAGGDRDPGRIALIMLAMTAFYVGGMYLNDFFDREIDARDRPGRPIEAGEIRAGTVSSIGFGLLATGVALMIPFGLAATLWGALLAAVIVLYDVWHKGNVLSPIVMGTCRALVYVGTGAALAGSTATATMIGAIALASHVAGITYAAKQESLDRVGNLWPLALLAVPLLAALPAIAGGGWIVITAFFLLLAADAIAVRLLAIRPVPGAVPLAVSGLIAAICLVDALAIALNGGGVLLIAMCAAGYLLTRLFQKSIPGT